MKSLNILTMATLLTFGLTSCNAESYETASNFTKLENPITDSVTKQTLVITKVKKPWYAWRSLVVRKMEASIPEYKIASGLNQKFYCLSENHKFFGGIYFWQTKEDALTWFNQAWYDRTEKKYGIKGIVIFYKIQSIKTIATVNSNAKNLYATIAYENKDTALINSSAEGLLNLITLKDEKNQTCFLTIWQNQKKAKDFFKINKTINEYFDVPFFIINEK